jgi:hypothetical protein
MKHGIVRATTMLLLSALLLHAAGCATTLVQPYDEKLLTDTEALFKRTSAMIDDGIAKSPRTDEERATLRGATGATSLARHPAHAAKFESRYNKLATDADALILRALAHGDGASPRGDALQAKIEKLVVDRLPSACPEADAEFAAMSSSLTVRNYVDLKCILVKWREQHSDPALTDSTGILKRSNWELRRSTLFAAVLVIQRAEMSKKP